MDQPLQIAGGLFLVLPVVGCIYLVLAGLKTRAFFHDGGFESPAPPVAVTVLKPLHGDEPGLDSALTTFLAQDYGGEVQIILGVREPDDPARATAERLCAAHPDRDLCVVVDPRRHGANGKISNLVNMAARAKHPILVLSDSDISVPSNYLSRVVRAVEGRSVGAVTCPYYGAPKAPRLWSLLAAMGQTYQFLPSVVVGSSIGLARPCMGSTIALRRDVLQEIGGFEAFADRLADDYAIGEAVRAAGYRTVVAPVLVAHGCAEASLRELLAHEQRWARTIRGVDPAGFLGSGITHAFVLALLGFVLLRGAPAALAVLVMATVCRLWMLRQVARVTAVANEPWWLFPVRDILSFVVFVSSFFVTVVDWRGARFRVDQRGGLSGI